MYKRARQAGETGLRAGHAAVATRREARYLYCVVDRDRVGQFRTDPVGGPGNRLYALGGEGMAVVMSVCRPEDCGLDRANALNHQRVMEEALAAGCTVLPIRYGTIAERDDAQEVEALVRERLLRQRRSELAGLLDHLAGRYEMVLKVVWKDLMAAVRDLARDNAPGRSASYIQSVRIGMRLQEELHRRRELLAAAILGELRPLAADARVHAPLGDRMVLNAAFLMDERGRTALDEAVARLAGSRPDLLFRYLGPAPPGSFVELTISWD